MSTRGNASPNENAIICGTEPDQTFEPSKLKVVYGLSIMKGTTTIIHNANMGTVLGIIGY